jgi:predicted adenylyl cyclase CyaB
MQEKIIEVEIKYQVLDEKQLKNFLKNLKFVGKKREVDVYFDTPVGSLYKKSSFIRVRNNKSLDFKYSLAGVLCGKNGKISKDEHFKDYSFPLPLAKKSLLKINQICKVLGLQEIKTSNLKGFKVKNNLVDSMIIDKIREKYKDGKFEYCLDKVKKLGTFLEIETLTSNEKEVRRLKREMADKLKGLKLKGITTGYCGLYWRKYNFNLYRQARYIMKEDRF